MTPQDTQDTSDLLSEYEDYEEELDLLMQDRREHRKRQPRVQPKRVSLRSAVSELAEPEEMEAGFETTYRPSLFERGWLLTSLRTFYSEGLITDVLALIKGGKEANVYRCAAHPATGVPFLAAKVYRPRMFRNLRNDSLYRQGRETLGSTGRVVSQREHRVMRAIEKKTAFGMQVRHISWLMYEFSTLQRLYGAGGAVPRPYAAGENAILMAYWGDAGRAAPTLQQVDLPPGDATGVYAEVLRNLELMLSLGLVHGDLSAYNILYWEGSISLIDFPQVIYVHTNREAHDILARDIERTCAYFERRGVPCDPQALQEALWAKYGMDLDPALVASLAEPEGWGA